MSDRYERCGDLRTAEARAVAKALDDEGFEHEGRERAHTLGYRIESNARVWFEPMLPHGEWICTPCG